MGFKDNGGKIPKIEVVIQDNELGKKVIIAQYQKNIIFPESFCEEMAEVIFNFLCKNAGKLAGKVKKDYRNFVFFEKPFNKKPFETRNNNQKRTKKRIYKNHHKRIIAYKNRNY